MPPRTKPPAALPRRTLDDVAGGRALLHTLDLLEANEATAQRIINMVPSENSLSSLAKLPLLLDVYHRYFFNDTEDPSEWNFRGAQDVAELETRQTLALLRELTGAAFVNIRPLSGLSGMTLILASLAGKPGSTVLTISPDQGGHYATASIARRLGHRVEHITGPDAHTIDYDSVSAQVAELRPSIVYVDQSNCLFPVEVDRLVPAVRSADPDVLVHVDASHWMGLILGKQHPNPLELGADSLGGSMHKTFPGPQKAVFVSNREDLARLVKDTQFFMISSHHFAATLSLGIALLEFKLCGGSEYARRVVENTRELGRLLHERGLGVDAADRGFSCGHQLWMRTSTCGVEAFEASERLYAAGLRVNVFPDLPGIPESVLRIGVNEATYHGLQRDDMRELADVFYSAVVNDGPPEKLRERVARLRQAYHLPFRFPSDDPQILERVLRIVTRCMTGDAPDDPGAALRSPPRRPKRGGA